VYVEVRLVLKRAADVAWFVRLVAFDFDEGEDLVVGAVDRGDDLAPGDGDAVRSHRATLDLDHPQPAGLPIL
jgi:hypothetical protein